MGATQDYVALDWIKGEISQTLEQAQFALEAVAESQDSGSMRSCLTSLHQVHGTLKMVELAGPSQVADEMEQLAQALMNEDVRDVGHAQEMLMQTILQMPAYLDLIQREQNDIEKNYLPLVNNLRRARGELGVGDQESDKLESGPNLSPVQNPPFDDVIEAYIAHKGESTVPKLRERYKQSLAALLKKSRPRESLSVMGKVFTMLIKLCGESPMGNLSRLGVALIEGVGSGAIRLSAPVAKGLISIDFELGKLAEGGSRALSEAVPDELALKILGILDDASKDTPRIIIAKEMFAPDFESGMPQIESIDIGPDDGTLAAVATILIEELHGLIDKLDLYVRSSDRNLDDLVDLLPGMQQILGTLAVVGMEQHLEAVGKQIEIIRGVEETQLNPEEETLLEMAKDLLGVEAALGSIAGEIEGGGDADSFGDLDEAQGAVVRETRIGLAKCRDALIEFVASDFDHSKIESLPVELSVLRGGLLMANQERSGNVLMASARYTEEALLKNNTRPELSAMDDLADAITSIDYFLERLLESSSDPYIQMIEVAEAALEKLGFKVGSEAVLASVVVEEDAVAEEEKAIEELVLEESVVDDEAPISEELPVIEFDEPEPEAVEIQEIESEETGLEETEFEAVELEAVELEAVELEAVKLEVVEPEVVEPEAVELDEVAQEVDVAESETEAVPEPGEFLEAEGSVSVAQPEDDDLIDEEILEIFVEEVDEVLENIGEYFPKWRNNYADSESLTELRRAFHTLKGSGRMVGATVLGELAWSIESMLNRVLDQTMVADEKMLSLVSDVINKIPEGLEFFRNQKQDAFLVDEMIARAEAISTAGSGTSEEVPAPVEAVTDSTIEEPEEQLPELLDEAVEELPDLHKVEPQAELHIEPLVEVEEEHLEVFEVEEPEPVTVKEMATEELSATDEIELEELEVEVETTEPEKLESFDFDLIEVEEIDPVELVPARPTVKDETVSSEEEPAEPEDLELDEIFVMEANERIEVIDQFLESPTKMSGGLVAALHTLKGSGAMAGVGSVAIVAAPLEHLSNHYLTSNKSPDTSLIALIDRGNTLIKAVIENLGTYRNEIAGMIELVADIEAAEDSSPEVVASFDFGGIEFLGMQDVVGAAWEGENHDRVKSELEGAGVQAESLGQVDLANLIQSLLRIHHEVQSMPNEEVVAALVAGHRHLVQMFDHLAASQEVENADELISVLDALDLSEIEEIEIEVPRVNEKEEEEEVAAFVSGEQVDEAVFGKAIAQESAGQELPEDEVDEDILPVFLEEADEILEGIDQSILHWSENNSQMDHLDLLLRHLHTLKGGSRMAGLNSLGEFTHNFETLLIGVQQNPVEFDRVFFGMLNERQDEITRRVEIYQKLEKGQATEEQLASLRFDSATDATRVFDDEFEESVETKAPETTAEGSTPLVDAIDLPADEIDEDIMSIFLEETDGLLEGIDGSIQGWSEETSNPEFLNNLLRHLHTLKGGARMAGMNSLGEFTHNFETFLIGLQQNPVELVPGFFALLNQRQDEITRRVGVYSKMVSGDVSEEATAQNDPVKTALAPVAHSQEMVRVSPDLLEGIEGLAGESSIIRGRIEQQISDFGESLQEMEVTIHRIRDQSRRLEFEAESRETLIRSKGSEKSEYDELELDRYTMLQEISRSLNESSSDLLDLKETLVSRSRDTESLLHHQARIGGELQEGLTRTRMVPFARLIPRLRRIVRKIGSEIGKPVRFDAFNIEGELDRNVLERMIAPLEHMLRNSVDHGIESVEKRRQDGKPEEGRISLRLSREGGYVILNISDDGGGINVSAVRAKAIERGLMTEDSTLSDNDIMQFILNAGFSTAEKITQISGRGVGMDVVVTEIKSLGGSISIDSTPGVGTEFTIRIPFTVSINRALMVVVKEEIYAVPLNTIEGIVRVSPYELEAYYQPDAPMFEYAGQPYHLEYMGKLLEQAEVPNFVGKVAPLPVLLARSGDNAVALQVDRVIGSREVVVKTLGPQFNGVGGVAGATVLGDGSVVIILDVMSLVRTHERQSAESSAAASLIEPSVKVRRIMIVDDSVTVRKVTTRLMERQGWEVRTAKDGLDAVNQLQEMYPDVVLLDIEMPRMDGFEVLRRVRHDERLKDLPIIMITSRTGEKHKQEALDLGVNRYLGKPFQEANLLSTIEEVISETEANVARS